MAKKINSDNLIHLEIQKLESKVNEFQEYLAMNTIVTKVTDGSSITLTEENQDMLHKEITIQIKMQFALFEWLPLLEKLKEKKADKIDLRGGAQMNGLFKTQN